MIIRNKVLIGAFIATTVFVAGAFADSTTGTGTTDTTSTGTTSTGVTSTGTTDTGSTSTGVTSTGTTDTTSTGTTSTGVTSTGTTSTGTTSTGTTSTGVTSTGTTSTGAIADIEKNRAQMLMNWGKFHDDYGFMKQFFKKYTTKKNQKAAEKEVQSILKNYHEEIKAILKTGREAIKSNTFDPTSFNASLAAAYDRHVAALLPYVDSAKVDAFKKFMDEKENVLKANAKLKKENYIIRREIKRVLSDRQRENVEGKLKTRSKNVLSRLNAQIDVLVARITDQATKDILAELKDIIEAKLNAAE